jgi:hypothetical protein
MKKLLLSLVFSISIFLNSFSACYASSNDPNPINDGPYIYFTDNKLKAKWIENNEVKDFFITPENFPEIKKYFNLLFNYNDLKKACLLRPSYTQNYKMIDSIGVITDVHGEYHTYIKLMKAMGIIDEDLNWKFGKGHLVVLGDIFDRGDMVTEILWHLFGLETQAEKAGGMVHVLLGNHELMMLSKDQDYINEKYKTVESLFKTEYCNLFSEESVLGEWLRVKPVALTINDILFVHAGISVGMVERNMKIRQINKLFAENIVGKDLKYFYGIARLKFLNEDLGPIWYRGYFRDEGFNEDILDSVLDFYDKAHIVVGHTTGKGILSLYNNKIFGADAGISINQPGEMLIYKKGVFYIGSVTGKRTKL